MENKIIKDIDGNEYHTIKIGDQIWTVENLKVIHYNDGTEIPLVTDSNEWSNLTTPGYCWYNNDINNKELYGALYNWYAVDTGKLAPAGWHVPTDEDWTTLSNYLGGEKVAGGKLRESNFSALPGGCRYYNGDFFNISYYGDWWSSTEFDASCAYSRYFNYDYEYLDSFNDAKSCGFSVRLVRDLGFI